MKEIALLFMGDFAPASNLNIATQSKGVQVWGDLLKEIEGADLSFINLECPLTTSSQAIDKSGPNIKADPKCVSALKCFDLVGLANNHVLDFGREGLSDTISTLEQESLSYIGAGVHKEVADKVHYQRFGDKTIAVIALCEREFSQIGDYGIGASAIDPIENHSRIMEAKSVADHVFVTLHAGHEYFPLPRPELRKLCHFYIDLGVDGVLCHHPHIPGACETYKGRPIAYSMGNTIFGRTGKQPKGWNEGYAVKLLISEDIQFSLIPYSFNSEAQLLECLSGQSKQQFYDMMSTYESALGNESVWLKLWHDFIREKTNEALITHWFPMKFKGLGRIVKKLGLLKWLCQSQLGRAKLNQVRCESHRDLLIQAYKNMQNN